MLEIHIYLELISCIFRITVDFTRCMKKFTALSYSGKKSEIGEPPEDASPRKNIWGEISDTLLFDITNGSEKNSENGASIKTGASTIFGEEVSDELSVKSGLCMVNGWTVPVKIVLGYDFYKYFFLNMENKDYEVSVLLLIMCFQKLARILGLTLSRDAITDILKMTEAGSDLISWKTFLQYIMGFERRHKFGGKFRRRNSTTGIDESVFALRRPTEIPLNVYERIYITMEEPASSWFAHTFSIMRVLIILLSTFGLVFESIPAYRLSPDCANPPCLGEPVPAPAFAIIEALTIIYFALDFMLRLCIVSFVRREILDKLDLVDMATIRDRVRIAKVWYHRIFRFVILPMSIVDIVSIAPFFVSLGISATGGNVQSGGFRIARIIRLVGVLRLLRMKQFQDIQEILKRAFSKSLGALSLLFFIFGIVILFFSVIIFYPEGGEWYESGSLVNGQVINAGAYYRVQAVDQNLLELTPFTSIPAGVWYALVTATTVGYGDMTPTTGWGKLVGGVLAMSGIVVLAMPIAVIGSNFSQEYTRFYGIRQKLIMSKEAETHTYLMERYNQMVDPGDNEVHNHSENEWTHRLEELVDGDDILSPILRKIHAILKSDPNISDVSEMVRECLTISTQSGRSAARRAAVEKIIFQVATEIRKRLE